jgi:hypothetical protein
MLGRGSLVVSVIRACESIEHTSTRPVRSRKAYKAYREVHKRKVSHAHVSASHWPSCDPVPLVGHCKAADSSFPKPLALC